MAMAMASAALMPSFSSSSSPSLSSSSLLFLFVGDGRRRDGSARCHLGIVGAAKKTCLVKVRRSSISTKLAATRSGTQEDLGNWRQVVDPVSGKPYFWNMETNETRWECPAELANPAEIRESSTTITDECHPQVALEELLNILLDADSFYFADVANKYRPQCFEDNFFDFLTGKINCVTNPDYRGALERLRARLANPLLKNPPPY